MKKNKFEIDMCNGSIMDKLISFSLPLMLTSILQLMFNAVDIIVVGRFSGSQALAAVGSTTALINIFTNLFIGISLGACLSGSRWELMSWRQDIMRQAGTRKCQKQYIQPLHWLLSAVSLWPLWEWGRPGLPWSLWTLRRM